MEALRAAREAGAWHWLRRWGFDAFERSFQRGGWEEMVHRFPQYGSELILVSYEWGARPWGRGLREPRGFPGEMLDELFHRGWREKGDEGPAGVVGRQGGTETAVASLLLALDGRSPEPPEKLRTERLRHFLQPEAMVRMIEDWPGATIELCLLAEGPRAPEWLSHLADGWLHQFTSPSTLMELLKKKPEAGTELLRLLRRIRSGRSFGGPRASRELPHFEEIGDPRYVMEILHSWPEAGFELVRLVSELDPQWLDRFADVWMREDMHPRAMMDLLYELPEIAIQVLRRSGDAERNPERRWLREILRPRVLMDILDRRPSVGVQLLRFVRESPRGKLIDEVAGELLERVLQPERSSGCLHRDPDVAVELLLLARNRGQQVRPHGVDQEWLDTAFPPDRVVHLLGPNPDASISILDLALESGSDRWLSRFCGSLAEMLNSADHGELALSKMPLGLVRRIEWAAERNGDQELQQRIQAVVRRSGEELNWGPHGRRRFRPDQ